MTLFCRWFYFYMTPRWIHWIEFLFALIFFYLGLCDWQRKRDGYSKSPRMNSLDNLIWIHKYKINYILLSIREWRVDSTRTFEQSSFRALEHLICILHFLCMILNLELLCVAISIIHFSNVGLSYKIWIECTHWNKCFEIHSHSASH